MRTQKPHEHFHADNSIITNSSASLVSHLHRPHHQPFQIQRCRHDPVHLRLLLEDVPHGLPIKTAINPEICVNGVPAHLPSIWPARGRCDWDSAWFWWAFCKWMGISLSLSSGYHPQTQGAMREAEAGDPVVLTFVLYLPWTEYTLFLPWLSQAFPIPLCPRLSVPTVSSPLGSRTQWCADCGRVRDTVHVLWFHTI